MCLASLRELDLLVVLDHYLGLLSPEGLYKAGSVHVPLPELAREVTRFFVVLIEWFVLVLTAFRLDNYPIAISRDVNLRIFFTQIEADESLF